MGVNEVLGKGKEEYEERWGEANEGVEYAGHCAMKGMNTLHYRYILTTRPAGLFHILS